MPSKEFPKNFLESMRSKHLVKINKDIQYLKNKIADMEKRVSKIHTGEEDYFAIPFVYRESGELRVHCGARIDETMQALELLAEITGEQQEIEFNGQKIFSGDK